VPLRSDLSGNEIYDSWEVFMRIFDKLWERYYVKPRSGPSIWAKIGKININTAPPEVLECLPYIGNQSCYDHIDYYRMLYREQSSCEDAYKFAFRYPSDIFYALHSNELSIPTPMDYIRSLCSRTHSVGTDADGDGYEDEDDEYERWALVANLITTNSYQFRILAVGQALRWVDTDGDGEVDEDEISITAERRVEAVVEREVKGRDVDIITLSYRELGQ